MPERVNKKSILITLSMYVIRYEFDQVLGAKHLIHSNRVVSKACYQILLTLTGNVVYGGIFYIFG